MQKLCWVSFVVAWAACCTDVFDWPLVDWDSVKRISPLWNRLMLVAVWKSFCSLWCLSCLQCCTSLTNRLKILTFTCCCCRSSCPLIDKCTPHCTSFMFWLLNLPIVFVVQYYECLNHQCSTILFKLHSNYCCTSTIAIWYFLRLGCLFLFLWNCKYFAPKFCFHMRGKIGSTLLNKGIMGVLHWRRPNKSQPRLTWFTILLFQEWLFVLKVCVHSTL